MGRAGRVFCSVRPEVCVSKPISLGSQGIVRKPGRPLGRVFQNYRPEVCVRKPISLGFRGIVRKPERPPGRVFQNFRPEVCVRKPILLGFRGFVRKPRRRPDRVQMKSDAWPLILPPHASTPFPGLMHEHPFFCSMHHFSPLLFSKEKN